MLKILIITMKKIPNSNKKTDPFVRDWTIKSKGGSYTLDMKMRCNEGGKYYVCDFIFNKYRNF